MATTEYLSSTDIKMYPSSFRDHSKDPASYLNTETNITQTKSLSDDSGNSDLNSYVIGSGSLTSDSYISVYLHGYSFKFKFGALTAKFVNYATSDIWAYIKLVDDNTYYTQTSTFSNRRLDNIATTGAKLDDSTDSKFKGIAFVDKEPTTGYDYKILVLSNGKIPDNSRLKLMSSEVMDSSKVPLTSKVTTSEVLSTNVTATGTIKATTITGDTINGATIEDETIGSVEGHSFDGVEVNNSSGIYLATTNDSKTSTMKVGKSSSLNVNDSTDVKFASSFNVGDTNTNNGVNIFADGSNTTSIYGPSGSIHLPSDYDKNSSSGIWVQNVNSSGGVTNSWSPVSSSTGSGHANSIVMTDASGNINATISGTTDNATKVTQDVSTSNVEFPILLSSTSGATSTKTHTDTPVFIDSSSTNAITANPSTGMLTTKELKVIGEKQENGCVAIIDTNGQLVSKDVSYEFPKTSDTPTAGINFISGIKQESNGVISCTLGSVQTASSNALGVIKLGYTESEGKKIYKVQADTDGNAYVSVPWTDTKYTNGKGLDLSSTTFNLKAATSSELGGIISQTTGTISGRDYNVEVDSDGKAKVNVPWTDTTYQFTSGTTVMDQGCFGVRVNEEFASTISVYNLGTSGKPTFEEIYSVNGTNEVSIASGGIIATGTIQATVFDASSDRRLKENIVEYKNKSSILDLPIVEFDYKNNHKHTIGCIAQDLQELYPELVDEDKDGYLSIQETKLVYLLIDEVKKLRTRVEELEKKE